MVSFTPYLVFLPIPLDPQVPMECRPLQNWRTEEKGQSLPCTLVPRESLTDGGCWALKPRSSLMGDFMALAEPPHGRCFHHTSPHMSDHVCPIYHRTAPSSAPGNLMVQGQLLPAKVFLNRTALKSILCLQNSDSAGHPRAAASLPATFCLLNFPDRNWTRALCHPTPAHCALQTLEVGGTHSPLTRRLAVGEGQLPYRSHTWSSKACDCLM